MGSVSVLDSDGFTGPLEETLEDDVVLPREDLSEERPAVGRLVAEDVDLLHVAGDKSTSFNERCLGGKETEGWGGQVSYRSRGPNDTRVKID